MIIQSHVISRTKASVYIFTRNIDRSRTLKQPLSWRKLTVQKLLSNHIYYVIYIHCRCLAACDQLDTNFMAFTNIIPHWLIIRDGQSFVWEKYIHIHFECLYTYSTSIGFILDGWVQCSDNIHKR